MPPVERAYPDQLPSYMLQGADTPDLVQTLFAAPANVERAG